MDDHHNNNTEYLLTRLNDTDKTKINNEYKQKLNKNTTKSAPMIFKSKIINDKIEAISVDWEEVVYKTSEIPECILKRYKKHLTFFSDDIHNSNYQIIWDNTIYITVSVVKKNFFKRKSQVAH
eukprot:139750_1